MLKMLLGLLSHGDARVMCLSRHGQSPLKELVIEYIRFITAEIPISRYRPFVSQSTAKHNSKNRLISTYKRDEPQGKDRTAARCYILADDRQVENASDEFGQLSLRQDMLHWSYNDAGIPQTFGGIVFDCVRMTLYNFWLTATGLTETECRHAKLPAHLQNEALQEKLGTEEFPSTYLAQAIELGRIAERERELERDDSDDRPRFARPSRHPRFR
jgi:hypothetical protein